MFNNSIQPTTINNQVKEIESNITYFLLGLHKNVKPSRTHINISLPLVVY